MGPSITQTGVKTKNQMGGREDWMKLTEDWGRWRALVGTVKNLRVPKKSGELLG
jgi:hypothetical protein